MQQMEISSKSLGELIQGAARRLGGVLELETARLPVQAPMAEVLSRLLDEPGQSQIALARLIAMDASTMGRAVDRLIAQGYIERRRSIRDRRAWSLFLTEEGRVLAERIKRIESRIEGEVATEMGQSDLTAVKALLSRFLNVSDDLFPSGRVG